MEPVSYTHLVNTFTYGNSSDQKYYAVQINAIKSGLDTFGISYINAGAQATTQTPDEEEPEEKEGPDADLVTALKLSLIHILRLQLSGLHLKTAMLIIK